MTARITMTTYDYKSYKLIVENGVVSVFDPQNDVVVHETTSLDEAMRWVNTYRSDAA